MKGEGVTRGQGRERGREGWTSDGENTRQEKERREESVGRVTRENTRQGKGRRKRGKVWRVTEK